MGQDEMNKILEEQSQVNVLKPSVQRFSKCRSESRADVLTRIFGYAAGFGYDLGSVYKEKMAYNAVRACHKRDARVQIGGKKW